jgi:hypothetical protein
LAITALDLGILSLVVLPLIRLFFGGKRPPRTSQGAAVAAFDTRNALVKSGLQAVVIVITGMVIGTVAGFLVGGHYDRSGTRFMVLIPGAWGAGVGTIAGIVVAFLLRHRDYLH